MADILIKNMEMPVDHGIFLVICPNGTIEQMVGTADNGYPIYNIVKDAKAVALPEHGDLVDVKAIEERAKEIQYERGITYKEALLLAFDEASVVVEATE